MAEVPPPVIVTRPSPAAILERQGDESSVAEKILRYVSDILDLSQPYEATHRWDEPQESAQSGDVSKAHSFSIDESRISATQVQTAVQPASPSQHITQHLAKTEW